MLVIELESGKQGVSAELKASQVMPFPSFVMKRGPAWPPLKARYADIAFIGQIVQSVAAK